MTTTATAPRIEFYAGQAPAAPPPAGPSVWPYQGSDRRVKGRWQPYPEPSVPVVLHSATNWATIPGALLDTGADVSVCPYGWAGPLSVSLEAGESLTAVANGVEAEFVRPVEALRLEIAGRLIDFTPFFGPWPTMALGRDVFDHFRVTFDQRAGHVILEPYDA